MYGQLLTDKDFSASPPHRTDVALQVMPLSYIPRADSTALVLALQLLTDKDTSFVKREQLAALTRTLRPILHKIRPSPREPAAVKEVEQLSSALEGHVARAPASAMTVNMVCACLSTKFCMLKTTVCAFITGLCNDREHGECVFKPYFLHAKKNTVRYDQLESWVCVPS
jgi:hypothetical protein